MVTEYKQCVGSVHGLKLNTEIIVRILLKLVTVVACTAGSSVVYFHQEFLILINRLSFPHSCFHVFFCEQHGVYE